MDPAQLSKKLIETAEAAGIDTLGFASATPFDDYAVTSSKRRDE